jgi:hypothetical protein
MPKIELNVPGCRQGPIRYARGHARMGTSRLVPLLLLLNACAPLRDYL